MLGSPLYNRAGKGGSWHIMGALRSRFYDLIVSKINTKKKSLPRVQMRIIVVWVIFCDTAGMVSSWVEKWGGDGQSKRYRSVMMGVIRNT